MIINGTTALVTGGASGLGASTAAALAARGARVVVLDLEPSIAKAPAIEGVEYIATDITDENQVEAAVAVAQQSDAPLRTVVNCAGIGPSMRILGRGGRHDLATYRRTIEVNLIGTFNVMVIAAEAIAGTDALEFGARGVIVNTASVAAYDGQVGQAAYASSKGGIVGLTLPAARDLAQRGIRVNTIAPGIIDTPLLATVSDEFRANLAAGVPFPQRLGQPDEYAALVCNIVELDYLNGETIRLDGALRMAPR